MTARDEAPNPCKSGGHQPESGPRADGWVHCSRCWVPLWKASR